MKRNAIVSAVLALSLAAAGPAFAQRDQDQQRTFRDGQRDGPQSRQRDQRSQRGDERGAGPDHRFHRGDRLPTKYRNRTYVVDDWRGHRLSAPPRGYHWVQVGGDYVLVAIATGVILQLLLNN
jgi:Ni/Co efflux regulator RcnB